MQQDSISVFDIFKIGIGPSSSHTLGPWKAALQLLKKLNNKGIESVTNIKILLYGSLAKTGKGHGTDVAIILGLRGENPETYDVTQMATHLQEIENNKKLRLCIEIPNGTISHTIDFDKETDIEFLFTESLPFHPNAMTFLCTFNTGNQISETYYSIGGGFVIKEGEKEIDIIKRHLVLPYPIFSEKDLIRCCIETGLNISELVLENEKAWRTECETYKGVLKIWDTMKESIYKGCHTTGILPGGLNVVRRAAELNKKYTNGKAYNNFDEWIEIIKTGGNNFNYTLDWVSCFALAVNEENASFSRVVTAPTNGSAGVIPAVLLYFIIFCDGNTNKEIVDFLLTASEIGSIFKKNATLSAAMGGCQAEIGVSSSMAAAALTQALGGSPKHSLMAAEIAMEHHLGLTCDPIAGLVQIPCIERNIMGAIKAITAAQLALQGNPENAIISLDDVVNTMWKTALDMNFKYKETAEGGLATLNLPLSLSDC